MNLGNLQIAQSNQPEDMMSHLGGVMQVADMMEQHQMNRQVMKMQLQRQQGIRQILQGSTSPDGQLDHVGAIQKMYQAGYGPEAQEYEQKFGEYQKNIAQAKSDTAHAETFNAEAEQKKVDTAKTYQDLMKRDDDKTSGLLHAAADAAKTDPTAASMYYGQAVTEHKANAQKWGRPADYMPDQFDPEKVGQIADAFDEHSQGHQEHIENQVKLMQSGLKLNKDRMEVETQFGPQSVRKGIGQAVQRIQAANEGLQILQKPVLTADDVAMVKQRLSNMPFAGADPTLYGAAQKLITQVSGQVGNQITESQRVHLIDVFKTIGKLSAKNANDEWDTGAKNWQQHQDMFDTWKQAFPRDMFDNIEAPKLTGNAPQARSSGAPAKGGNATAQAGGIPKFNSPNDPGFKNLPSGSAFIDSEGHNRIKH